MTIIYYCHEGYNRFLVILPKDLSRKTKKPRRRVRSFQRAADCIAAYEARCAALCAPGGGPAALAGLTGREREIAALIAARLTNGEIARRLFLSDGSVKQYVHQIYAKLGLTGDAKSKRQQLIDQWHTKP